MHCNSVVTPKRESEELNSCKKSASFGPKMVKNSNSCHGISSYRRTKAHHFMHHYTTCISHRKHESALRPIARLVTKHT